jgi:hypothetical protein
LFCGFIGAKITTRECFPEIVLFIDMVILNPLVLDDSLEKWVIW